MYSVENMRTAARSVWMHPSNRGHRIRAAAGAIAWEVHKRLFKTPKDVHIAPRTVMRCYPDSTVARGWFYFSGEADRDEMQLLKRYLRDGDGFVDVGANIGSYTLLAASLVGNSGHVSAFEPGDVAYARLQENVRINDLEDVVTIRKAAVSDEDGTVQFRCAQDATNRIKAACDCDASTIVESVRLDTVLAERRFSMGKVDVEGAEPRVFRGAERLLRDGSPPLWVVELNGKLRAYGFSEEGFSEELKQHGWLMGRYVADEERLIFEERAWVGRQNVVIAAQRSLDEIAKRLPGVAISVSQA